MRAGIDAPSLRRKASESLREVDDEAASRSAPARHSRNGSRLHAPGINAQALQQGQLMRPLKLRRPVTGT